MSIKALFLDLDCTLYDWERRRYDPDGISALKEAQKKGVLLFLCSSRPYDSMKEFGVYSLGIHWDGFVGNSGGVACLGKKIIYEESLKPASVRKALRLGKKMGFMAQIHAPFSRYYTDEPNGYFEEYAKSFNEPFANVHPYRGGKVICLLAFAPEAADEALKEALPECSIFRFHPFALEINAKPHSKGTGIAAMLKYLGIAPEEAAGFGDDYADIGMKEGLAHFIAMGNGREEVKAEAEFVTKRIEEGGMRAGLEYLGVI